MAIVLSAVGCGASATGNPKSPEPGRAPITVQNGIIPPTGNTNESELAANAVLHGRLPGRSFRLTLVFDALAGRLRIDVTDARGERWPQPRPATAASSDTKLHTNGRGLALVAAIADHWETLPHPPSGKTVRAELSCPA